MSCLSNGINGLIPIIVIYFLGFIHYDKQTSSSGYNSVEQPFELEGHLGEAKSDLRPAGIALIDGRRMDVVSEGEFIRKGDTIQIAAIKDGKIIVRKV